MRSYILSLAILDLPPSNFPPFSYSPSRPQAVGRCGTMGSSLRSSNLCPSDRPGVEFVLTVLKLVSYSSTPMFVLTVSEIKHQSLPETSCEDPNTCDRNMRCLRCHLGCNKIFAKSGNRRAHENAGRCVRLFLISVHLFFVNSQPVAKVSLSPVKFQFLLIVI